MASATCRPARRARLVRVRRLRSGGDGHMSEICRLEAEVNDAVHPTQAAKPNRRSALSCAPPARGATTNEMLARLTSQLRVPAADTKGLPWFASGVRLPSAATKVQRWGKRGETPVTIALSDERCIRFDAASDLFNPTRLVETVTFQLGADAPQLPLLSKADAQAIAIVLIRACEAVEE